MRIKKIISVFITLIMLFSFSACGTDDNKDENSDSKYELEFKNGERFFRSEVKPQSKEEEVIFDSLKIEISDKYNDFEKIYIENGGFDYYPELYKDNFESGLYTEEITIHRLKFLNENELNDEKDKIKFYNYMDNLKKYNPYEFKIIQVSYTNKLTDKYDEQAQWGSGNWTRNYIVVKEKEDSEWRIFDIYGSN